MAKPTLRRGIQGATQRAEDLGEDSRNHSQTGEMEDSQTNGAGSMGRPLTSTS